ncbi:MAG: histidine kinase [Gammaproteobacteria bacterium]|nr:MAG: histidine kinase [Pseudomonadota bacterium]PIE38103.1 MAG: histidine kinase [Gammaproteobacteria bacterium]
MEHIDLNAIAELKEVMEEEFGILIETYLQDSVERLRQLKSALEANDPVEFSRAAHSFKGSCTNIGAPVLAEYCLHAEKMGKSGNTREGMATYRKIEAEFREVDGILREYL